MKTSPTPLRNLALASLLGTLALSVQAQSSVSIYGLLDLSVGSTKAPGGTATTALDSGKLTTSYIGFGGTEDLGGGLAATFRLESFMRADTGAAARFDADTLWSRTASVGLTSKSVGALNLGRTTTALFVNTLLFNAIGDSFGYSPSIRHYFTSGTVSGDSGWNQSIAYSSPSMGGVRAGFATTAKTGNGGNTSVNVGYASGPFSSGLVYQKVKKDSAVAAVADTRTVQLGLAYDLGVAKLFGQVGEVKNLTTPNSYSIAGLGARVPLGAGAFVAQYGSLSPDTGADRDTFTLGYLHNLSKRSELYAVAMSDKVDGQTSGRGYSLGFRHRF